MNQMPKKSTNMTMGYVEIAHDRFHVRKDATPFAESLGKPTKGEKLPWLGRVKKAWVKVKFNGQEGWISNQAGTVVEVKEVYLKIKKGSWHVKAAPDAKGKSLGVVKGGDKILDQGQTNGSYRLVMFKNQNGWISNRAIEK